MKERYKLRQKVIHFIGVWSIKDKHLRKWYMQEIPNVPINEQEILPTTSIYFEVHFSETKNKGEFQGKKGYFYKLHTMLQFSEINPVKFHYYNSEEQLRGALEDFGEIEKITRVTNMNPLVF